MSLSPTTLALSLEDRALLDRVDALARSGRDGVTPLVDLLSHPSWALRRAVVNALANLGDDAVPALLDVLLERRNHEARVAATVDALVASRGNVDRTLVDLAASDAAAPIVCDAVQVLGRRRTRAAVPVLSKLATHPDDNVAVGSIEALGRIGGVETVDALVAAVASRHFFRTFPAIDALGRTGDARAIEPLQSLLNDPLYAPEAIRALGRSGHESAVPSLGALLVKQGASLTRTAAVALAELRERHEAQFGETESLARSLPGSVDAVAASSRLIDALSGVVPSELVAIARVFGWLGDDIAIAQLIEMVMSEPPVDGAAADALRRLGPRATPALMSAIRDGDSQQRLRLLPIVGYASRGVDSLVACLEDPSGDVRVRACEALARLGNTSAVSALFRLIGDRDGRVSQAASAAIQSLGSLETRRLALQQARSTDASTRRAALRIISYFGYPEGLDVLIEAMNDDDEKIREAAIYGIPLVDEPRGTAALLAAAKHPASRTRAAIMRALGQTEKSLPVIAALNDGLLDPDAWTRYYACQSLGRLRVDDAASEIVAVMDDPSGQVRVAAVEALAHLEDARARAALERAARSTDGDIRRAALVGLGIARRPESVTVLRQAASAEEAPTRLVAIGALSAFESAEVVPTLAHAASDPDEGVRNAAIGYLSTRPGAEATAALLAQLDVQHDRPHVRERIIEALAVAPDERIDGILQGLETADGDRAPVLVAALTRMRRPSSQAAIASALSLENVHARRAAASALVALGTPEAKSALARAGSADPDDDVRRICNTATR